VAYFDFREPELRTYTGSTTLPTDFEEFWRTTLKDQLARDLEVRYERVTTPITAYDVYDLSFLGYDGARINTWVRVPAGATGPLPTVVNYMWYNGGRGYPWVNSHFAQAGMIHITMDSRAQGWRMRNLADPTPDPDLARGLPTAPGYLTSSILDKDTYYYRRLYIDTIRLLQTVMTLDWVDGSAVFVTGTSQGGGLSLVAAGLAGMTGIELTGVMPDVPFLCDFPRSIGLTDAYPYTEVVDFLKHNPQFGDQVFSTLSYFDAVNFARFAVAPALFSVALMDRTCPPSSVYAAYNTYADRDKTLKVWPWNDHEGGADHMIAEQFHWVADRIADQASRSR
jgi:cephalosporin-C deacetylase